jgi:hypothetical protein
LKTSHPDVQTEEGPPRGILWQQPLYVSRASRGHGPTCDCSPEQLGPSVL